MPQEIMGGIEVEGLAQLTKTFQHAPKDVRLAYRKELRTVAEPVRSTAERLATQRIRKNTVKWSKFRTGVSQKLVYVAPRQRGVKSKARDSFRRPKFGILLAHRASQPALRQNEWRINQDFDHMLDRLVHKWNNEGKK